MGNTKCNSKEKVLKDITERSKGIIITNSFESPIKTNKIIYTKNVNFHFRKFKKYSIMILYSILQNNYKTLKKIKNKKISQTINTVNLRKIVDEKTLNDHNNPIYCLIQLSERKVVSGDSDGLIKIWDIIYGECLITINSDTSIVYCLTKINEKQFASGSGCSYIKVWYIITGNLVSNIFTVINYSVQCLVRLDDNKVISRCYKDNLIKIWDINTEKCLKTFIEEYKGVHSRSVSCLIKLNKNHLVSCNSDDSISIWSIKYEKSIKTFKGSHKGPFTCLIKFGFYNVITGSGDGSIISWNLKTRRIIHSFHGNTGSVDCIVKVNENLFASSIWDFSIKIWNYNTSSCFKTIYSGNIKYIKCLIKINEYQLMSASMDNTIKICDII